LLQAGAGVKGEFENRLKSVIQEVQASPSPIILFIDEAHTLIGAGGAAGSGDAANLLKPALPAASSAPVAATTFAEYKEIVRGRPGPQAALPGREGGRTGSRPGRGDDARISGVMEKHHKSASWTRALQESVRLSPATFRPQLPDKSVSLIDTACARVALSQSHTPPALEDNRREIEMLNVPDRHHGARTANRREPRGGVGRGEGQAPKRRRPVWSDLEKPLGRGKKLVEKIQQLRAKLGYGAPPARTRTARLPPSPPLAASEAPRFGRVGQGDGGTG